MAHSTWQLAARTLRRHPGRTTLMGLGLVIGSACLTVTVATGEGARRAVEAQFRAMIGELDVLLVMQGGPASRGTSHLESSVSTLVVEDAEAIRASVPNVRDVGSEQIVLGTLVEGNSWNGAAGLIGATPNWPAVRGDSLAAGSFFTEQDAGSMARVAVIGSDLASEFFPEGNAVGQSLKVRGVDFDVIGVLRPRGSESNPSSAHMINMDKVVYVPLSTAQRRVLNRDWLNVIRVKLADNTRWEETQEAVEALLRERHAIAGVDTDDFRVMSPAAMIAGFRVVQKPMRRAVLWIGVLSLLIGGVVVANLMFAATVSRSQEIGTRRAVGATRVHVLSQFWAEAVLVAIGAALAGAAAAGVFTTVGSRAMGMPLVFAWPLTLAAIAATIGIGALAGYFPARRAATLPPGVALRAE